jgi:DNA-binding NarL/FixJ family response regulator
VPGRSIVVVVERHNFEHVVHKRAAPKLAVLTLDYHVISSEPRLNDFLASFGIECCEDVNTLPSSIVQAIREAVSGWPPTSGEPQTAACNPIPGLLIHVSQLCGPDGCCLAVTFERIRMRADARETALRLTLTEREAEIGALLVRGMSGEHIAEELGIAPNTVREHLKNIHKKLGVSTRAELVCRLLNTSAD